MHTVLAMKALRRTMTTRVDEAAHMSSSQEFEALLPLCLLASGASCIMCNMNVIASLVLNVGCQPFQLRSNRAFECSTQHCCGLYCAKEKNSLLPTF